MTARLKIAIFSPSSPGTSVKIADYGLNAAKQYLQDADFIPEDPPETPALPYLAREDRVQASYFSKLISDKELDYIWFVRGGYGSIRWLGQVEWPKPPYPVPIGFSDATSILNSIVARGGLAIHGPMINTLKDTFPYWRRQLFEMMKGAPSRREWQGKSLVAGVAKGHLIGGNLSTIVSCLGTRLEPLWEGALLFLEDYQESLYRLDRMLTQLLLSGRLEKVAGIVIGQFLSLGNESKLLEKLLLNRFRSLGVPVIWEIPAGHGPMNAPLLLGAEHKIDGSSGILYLT